jgi:predicted Zn finger-like uncharacterized protein
MSSGLATRCSACGTVFRVVPDQLRVSEGWVRCGRCAQVFNALEALVDLDTGLPRREFGAPDGDDDGSGFAASRMPALDVPAPAPRPPAADALPTPAATDRPAPAAPMAAGPDGFASTAAPDSRPSPPEAWAASPQAADALAALEAPAGPSAPARPPPSPTGPGQAPPSFLRQAERAARWRRPGVRLALGAGVLLAAALLAAQLAHTWRDHLAVRHPALAPALAAACNWLGCELGAARVIDALSVESSGLVRVERSNLYRLQLSLKNRAGHAVAPPAVDLVLTDARGDTVSRRVLTLAELGGPAEALDAGSETTVAATLEATAGPGGAPRVIAGYTVELFYP